MNRMLFTLDIQRTLFKEFLHDARYAVKKAIRTGVNRNINALPDRYLSPTPARDQATIDILGITIPNPFLRTQSDLSENDHVSDLLRLQPEVGDILKTQPIGCS